MVLSERPCIASWRAGELRKREREGSSSRTTLKYTNIAQPATTLDIPDSRRQQATGGGRWQEVAGGRRQEAAGGDRRQQATGGGRS